MTTPVEKRNANKFCEFHGEVGHNTDDLYNLRKQIEENCSKRKVGETAGKDKAMAILMVQPWERVSRQRITQSFSPNLEILFPPLGEDEGMEGLLIIEAEIGSHCVHRMYVDDRPASEILSIHTTGNNGAEEHSHFSFVEFVVVRSPSRTMELLEDRGLGNCKRSLQQFTKC
ncbi:hypothetical protein Tco_0673016 [Tanacetum coccineum]